MKEILINRNKYLKLKVENLIFKDIYIKNKLKNYDLLMDIINFLAINIEFISVKEIHKTLNVTWIKVSHITLIEYINYIVQSWLINKIYKYNLKLKTISNQKAKYLFRSSNIKKAFYENINKFNLSENIIYHILIKYSNHPVFTWKNWTFNFSFITKKLIIHISKHLDKKEIKKEAKKLLKIEWNYEKYLIINSIKKSWLRPSTYLPLKIIEIETFIKEFKVKN